MTQLTHGGDWAGYRAQYGHDALDFSANVSPLGLPQGVANAIAAALPHADRYPDPLCRALRAKLAPHEGIPAESILCGNGAADLIFRLAWAAKPRTALVTAPTFAEYAAALEGAGCVVRRHFLQAEVDFAVTDSILSSITPEVDMVFLCQPNNPTGQVTPLVMVQKLLRRCADCGAVLVVDECFLDFLAARDALTAKTVLRDAPNLIILKAFTKLYAMAGVRLGYALCSDTALLDKMRAAGQPWAVSGLAQAAGLAALEETAYADSVRTLIADQRPRLAAGLRALGLRVVDGQANYLLFRAPADFGAKLRRHGAVVRGCGNYPGLDETWYRTAVRTQKENEQLLKIMREVLA
ncbi:MAG: aminotransferase class I/II-fold pyridoxal phosphate-dependent enzyme [Gemmiger sp.]|uniref:pyridoxal phosphate-dependent aminotransferase n=1 Tax=Gemmiger sp. TaxID=2049027 RepID=UPI0028479053|nr:aminotransferase class I/II-fold pyridoxal phosphate-dependent enzyme [Gemmiger sp.]MDR3942641.1 aminotransferase class I/II-fold pyridoxal phosphate-dependent enzyme [Gemmiger sp.]